MALLARFFLGLLVIGLGAADQCVETNGYFQRNDLTKASLDGGESGPTALSHVRSSSLSWWNRMSCLGGKEEWKWPIRSCTVYHRDF